MKHILKILKKYTFQIIIILVLLYTQAMFDLSLPEYTSKIVNIGIQQGGIETPVFEVIREEEFNKILLFLDSEQQNKLKENYTLINGSDYKIINEQNLYVLNENHDDLKDLLIFPIIMVYNIEKGNINLDVSKDKTLFETIELMNEEEKKQFLNKIKNDFSSEKIGLMEQSAIMYINEEYQQIGIDVNKIQMDYIINTGLKMIALALGVVVLAITVSFLSSRLATFFGRDLRSNVVKKVMSYSNSDFEELQTASLITRTTNDVQQVQMLIIMLVRIVVYAPIMGFGALSKVSGNQMSFVIGIAVFLILSLVIVLFIIALPKLSKIQKLIDKLNLVSREILTGIPVIRAFGNEKYEEKRFDMANRDLTKVNLFVDRMMTIMMPTMTLIMNGICVLIIWVGASKIDSGTIQVGTLMAFITYTMQIIMSFLMISMVSIMVPRSFISIKRIAEVLNKESSIKECDHPLRFKNLKGTIEFKDVYFRYKDATEYVLQDISFKVLSGTTTAIIGSTGSGKSTLVNLIPRFFDVTSGKILVDGIDIRKANLTRLRSKIGYVPQKGILFKGTIKSNVCLASEKITKADMIKACEISQAKEFIEEKKDKYDSLISQGGTNVSGGQKQRLSIARAIAKKPEIFIFDDSFSALDYKTDVKLRQALKKNIKNATILIVAQRISTIMHANQIIVLDKGKIVGIGKHKELLNNCKVYKEIAYSQLSKEELENA